MKNIPLIISIIIILIFGTVLGFFIFKKIQKDSSFVQSNVQSASTTDVKSSHSLVPVHSNQWYSSIYKDFPTNPIYAFPLAFKISESGIGISTPKNDYKENTVFATYNEDLVIGFKSNLKRPEISSIGDFSLNLLLKSAAGDEMKTFLGHGFAYTILEFNSDSDVVIKSSKNPKFFQSPSLSQEQQIQKSDHLIIQIDGKNYALFFNNRLSIEYSKNEVIISNPKKMFLAILDKAQSYTTFEKHKNDVIEDTRIIYTINENYLETSFSIQSNNENPLVGLLPHQFDILNDQVDYVGEYETLRGPLKLVEKSSFSTAIPILIPSDLFKKTNVNEKLIVNQIKTDVKDILKNTPPDSKNYYLGTWFGMISNQILLCDTYGLEDEKNNLINFVHPILEESFNYYKYDNLRKSLISTKPEFGNEELNDHHFHYSYSIRLASILLENGRKLSEKGKDTLNLMVKDIANYDRAADDFSYLRNFDPYEGHSWADGYADANDGNNQESSSEAINAWYSTYLWGKAVDDKNLEDIGLALFNSEINSTLYYWFDKNHIYKNPYKHRIASIVWGGKVDFATWFSPKTNMKYGIQLLPFTPASEYLSKIQNFSEYENHFNSVGGNVNEEWGDLFLMLKSYHSKVDIEDINKNLKNYDRNSKSLIYYIISKNQE